MSAKIEKEPKANVTSPLFFFVALYVVVFNF
jgi:hypothetical protein